MFAHGVDMKKKFSLIEVTRIESSPSVSLCTSVSRVFNGTIALHFVFFENCGTVKYSEFVAENYMPLKNLPLGNKLKLLLDLHEEGKQTNCPLDFKNLKNVQHQKRIQIIRVT